MSLVLRRGISWVLTLGLLSSLAIGITHLPGSGGTLDEIRWLLRRDGVPSRDLNRASLLIRMLGREAAHTPGQVFQVLFSDKDPRIVHGAMRAFIDQRQFDLGGPCPKDMCTAYSNWFRRASVAEKTATLPQSFYICFVLVNDIYSRTVDPVLPWDPMSSNWPLPATGDDLRWIVAATLQRGERERHAVDLVVFRRDGLSPYDVVQRLRRLDGMSPPINYSPPAVYSAVELKELRKQLWLSVDDLATMLSDPISEVRWGAGRILAVAGDERGLPALREWLKHNPRFTPLADKLMIDLYGPDWRSRSARGSATSQPGPRNGSQ